MLISHTIREHLFRNADGTPTGSPSANQGGANPTATTTVTDPYAGIDFDLFDEGTRKVMEAGKTQFATLQKQLQVEQEQRTNLERVARNFQSRFDQLQAQVNSGTPQGQTPEQQELAMVEKILTDGGITTEQAKAQAPIFNKMFGAFSNRLKGEIGRDLAPIGATVMQNQATGAWQEALSQDRIAALQIPEVANKTWEAVQQMVKVGQPVDSSTILNLRNIYYTAHIETNGQQPNMNNTSLPPMPNWPNMGRPGFAGGNAAQQPPQRSENAPRHILDATTAAAIAAVTKVWAPYKKGGK